ncbi:hypothetical protein ABIH81_26615 [Micromonospora sp. HUAS YX12]|uniref:Dihydroorotase n=1 Tax=Micromonospora sp. HUAS YX12 TaxID=3156396 RepID=A0AAU7QYC2_9ACTN
MASAGPSPRRPEAIELVLLGGRVVAGDAAAYRDRRPAGVA